jgi:ubiquinol-cytochrome c reductase cytochrome c1 subunit
MIRKIALTASALALSASAALAAGGKAELTDVPFAHEGPFGKFDQMQLQRGLQVFTEVCAACHGLKFVPIRTLSDDGGPGMPEDQVRAYAASLSEITDKETGEDRPRAVTDHFPESGLEGAPDLSLMTKARAGFHGPYGTGISQLFNGIGGSEYMYSILTHYEENPECAPDGIDGFYYNSAFPNGGVPDSCKDEHGASKVPGSWISMPNPLSDDLVTYADGHPATVANMAEDVSVFLTWTAEPKMMARKETGFKAVVFLILLSTLLYLTNKRIWASAKGKKIA